MHAIVGDKLVVNSPKVGQAQRVGVICEVRGSGGGPPYVVEFEHEDGRHTIWPGTDARIEHEERPGPGDVIAL